MPRNGAVGRFKTDQRETPSQNHIRKFTYSGTRDRESDVVFEKDISKKREGLVSRNYIKLCDLAIPLHGVLAAPRTLRQK